MTKDESSRSPLALEHGCELDRLPLPLRTRFVRLEHDADAREYVALAEARRSGTTRTLLQRTLRWYMSDFDANGLLDMYPMYLLGTAQWRKLLGSAARGRLLDVGAGSGDVTVRLAPLFAEVVTTETSAAMSWRLRKRGFRCENYDVGLDGVPTGPYDVISCLNVLDRTRRPLSLLRHVKAGLAPGGRLVLSLPLPYSPHYYDGSRTLDPEEPLPIASPHWESGAALLVDRVLEPLGLELETFTRAPYLSGGDSKQAVYELDAAVCVCRGL
jgi:SAM-dependent methyltransferase